MNGDNRFRINRLILFLLGWLCPAAILALMILYLFTIADTWYWNALVQVGAVVVSLIVAIIYAYLTRHIFFGSGSSPTGLGAKKDASKGQH